MTKINDSRIAEIRDRWGWSREDFDWSLHGSALRGERAVKDIRYLLSALEASESRLKAAEQEIAALRAHDQHCEAEQPVLPVTGYTACGCAERAERK